MTTDNPITPKEFDEIYSKVPRLTVEIVVKNKDGAIYLTKRAIEPCKGQWHLPGGTVRFGEPVQKAVKRIAKRELGIGVNTMNNVGYIEYPSHYKQGLDSPVGIVFEIGSFSGALKLNEESQGVDWFVKIPENLHADQDSFLISHGYLST